MQNVLLRPGLERKSFERGAVVPLGRAPETKDKDYRVTPDTKELFDDFQKSFKQYRTKQDGRIDELQTQLDKALMEAKRPIVRSMEDGKTVSVLSKAWNDYLRYGNDSGLMEEKALSAGSGPDGGYTVPTELANRIIDIARNRSNIRQIAQTMQSNAGMFQIPAYPGGMGSGWVGEQTARPQTTSPELKLLSFPVHEFYAMPAATQTLLDDSGVLIENWLGDKIADELSIVENTAFVNGDGVAKPRGFMNQSFVAQASWGWGNVGYIPTGLAGDFIAPTPTASPADALITMVYKLKTEYRRNASWVMNSNTVAAIRKFKDTVGRPIWVEAIAPGQPATLLGYNVTVAEDMPDIGADLFPVAFGDFSRAYLIVDRIGIRTLRDPFTAKPYVLFYTTKRVGGGVLDYDAYKVLKVALN